MVGEGALLYNRQIIGVDNKITMGECKIGGDEFFIISLIKLDNY